ncbi:MAG: SpoIID/LytB domain-containing protein [Actinomycetota bacterium]|nr:SpoIID/LytB domain-containing protein [Actinomycetota bacterium]
MLKSHRIALRFQQSTVAGAAIVVIAALCLSVAGPAVAQKKKEPPRKRPLPTSAVGPVRLVAAGDTRLEVAGHHAYLDSIEISPAPDGLVITNRLPLERYVLGLNEVPPDWPLEALKAQAIAARTYALQGLLKPPSGDAARYGFDICATIECQVFTGADVLSLPDGARWAQAVQSTANQVVLYRGAPILARYHSTSGGRTFDNEDVFYEERAYPYLQSVPSPYEQEAPLWRWHVTFPRARMQALLERAGWWGPDKGRLVSARTVSPSTTGLPYPDIVFRGSRGSLRRLGDDFRTIARDLAPGMFPGVYPSAAPDTPSGILPETLPSERFRVATVGDTVHFYGRGWGHGTGMSQWGAYGMAKLGFTYDDILTYYYRDTNVSDFPYKGGIEVGVAWAKSSTSVSGAFSIVDGRGKTIVPNAIGTWGFGFTGGDRVSFTPGDTGRLPSSAVKLPSAGAPIDVSILEAPESVAVGESINLLFSLDKSARVTTVTANGGPLSDMSVQLQQEGKGRISWLAPLKPGTYRVRVQAISDSGSGISKPIVVKVRPLAAIKEEQAAPEKPAETAPAGVSTPLTLTALFLLLIVGSTTAAVTISGWPKRQPSRSR